MSNWTFEKKYLYSLFSNFHRKILVNLFWPLLSIIIFSFSNLELRLSNPNKTSCILNYPKFCQCMSNIIIFFNNICIMGFSLMQNQKFFIGGFKHCFHLAVSFVGQSTLQLEKVPFICYVSTCRGRAKNCNACLF